MVNHKWGKAVVLCLVVLLGPTAANATQVFINPWDSGASEAGGFAQPGMYTPAGEFSLIGPATVNRATWYGTMFSPDPLNTGDTWSFDVVFWTENNGLPDGILSRASVVASVTDTGLDIADLSWGRERAYVFDASFGGVALSGNTPYFMSVINTGTPDTFRWNLGLDAAHPAYVGIYSSWNGTTMWVQEPLRPILNFALYDEGSTPAVPAPGALLLTGLGASMAAWLRRRGTL
jgi:hypothetical protein